MTYIICSLISAFLTASSTVFLKMGLRSVDPVLTATIQLTIANLFLIAIYFSMHGFAKTQIVFSELSLVVLAGIVGGISWIFYVHALKYGPMVNVVLLEPINIIFIVIMCALLLGEWSLQYFIGAVLITIGACLVTI